MAIMAQDGAKSCGVAVFDVWRPERGASGLRSVSKTDGDNPDFGWHKLSDVTSIVYEIPHPGKGKARGARDKQNAIALAVRAGYCAGVAREQCRNRNGYTSIPSVSKVVATNWKGTATKEVFHRRILASLTPEERFILAAALEMTPASYHGDLIDAVGVGLWALGRLPKGGMR